MEAKKKQNEEQQTAELSGEELKQAAGGAGGSFYPYKCRCGWTGNFSSPAEAQEAHERECPDCKKTVSKNYRLRT